MKQVLIPHLTDQIISISDKLFLTNSSLPKSSAVSICLWVYPKTLGIPVAPEQLQVSVQPQVSLTEGALAPQAQARAALRELHPLCRTLRCFFEGLGEEQEHGG